MKALRLVVVALGSLSLFACNYEPKNTGSLVASGQRGGPADTATGSADIEKSATVRPKKGEKVVHLDAEFTGAGPMVVESNYKVRQLDGRLTKEFEVEVEKGNPGDSFAVTLDGTEIGRITIERKGKGQLEFSDSEDPEATPFPANFREPRAGSVVKLGDSMEGKFEDVLANPKKK